MFVFLLPDDQVVVVFADNDEEAVCQLAEQLSATTSSWSDNPDDYWRDIADGKYNIGQGIRMWKQANETSKMSDIRICERSLGDS